MMESYPMSEIRINESNYDGPNIREPGSNTTLHGWRCAYHEQPRNGIISVMEAYNEDPQNDPIYSHFGICYYEEEASLFVNWVAKKYPQYCNRSVEQHLEPRTLNHTKSRLTAHETTNPPIQGTDSRGRFYRRWFNAPNEFFVTIYAKHDIR